MALPDGIEHFEGAESCDPCRNPRGTNMSTVTEIAPDVYRISTYVPEFDLQFHQFLVQDDEPLLYHTGTRATRQESGTPSATDGRSGRSSRPDSSRSSCRAGWPSAPAARRHGWPRSSGLDAEKDHAQSLGAFRHWGVAPGGLAYGDGSGNQVVG